MNELLQKHGCANVFTVPEGLRELMSDITREVLRDQPAKIFDYIANYLSVLLITREHGILAVRLMDDLCDCKPSVSQHLLQLDIDQAQVAELSQIIKEAVETVEPVEGKEKVKETQILKKILAKVSLDEDTSAKVCQVARNAYRDYWYKKSLMEKRLSVQPNETWEIAAERTLQLYKKTNPSFSELTRATEKIQAAYRGYYIRRKLLRHLKPRKKKRTEPKTDLPGPPADVAGDREIDLGPVLDMKVFEDNVGALFEETVEQKLGLQYDPMKTITNLEHTNPLVLIGIAENVPRTRSRHARLTNKLAAPIEIHQPSLSSEEYPILTSNKLAQTPELHKISFSEMPPEVIAGYEDDLEIPEEPEVKKVPEVKDIKLADAEAAQEVPEEIPDHSDSVPTASVPSSAPDTANTTDVEDIGEDVDTGEEE